MRRSSPDGERAREEFERQVTSGRIGPLYLFEGPERWLLQRGLRLIREAVIEPALEEFNVDELSVAGGNLEEALRAARQYPMMASRRLVVVRDFESISEERPLEALKGYLRSPTETTVLVFKSAGLDNRRTISTLLKKGCQVVSFPLFDDQQATRWTQQYVREAGGGIDSAAAAQLVGRVGVELSHLVPELEKLLCHAGATAVERRAPGRTITPREVSLLVRDSREHSNFELTDAILAGDRRRALRLLDQIYRNGSDSPQSTSLMMLGAIASNFRRLAIAKDLMRKNLPNSEVAQALGMSPYAVGHINEKARRASWPALERGMTRIAQTDIALKSSLGTPRLQMELLVCELTAHPAPPKRQGGPNFR
jgi:DNA polymerase-3 subunit delta